VLQRSNGRNEQIGLTERVTALSALNHHRLPSDDHVFRDRKNAPGKQRAKISFQPKTKVGAAGGVAELFDTIAYFRQRDVSNEQRLAWLSSNETSDFGTGFGFAQFGNDVGVEQPSSHRSISRTWDLIVRRSKFTSASGEAARASTISRPLTGR